MTQAIDRYQAEFAATIGVPHAFAFWKGRVALYAILKALGVGRGDEVAIPGYTCVMAVNPIVYLGAKPVFVDIEPVTYNVDPELLKSAITPRTRVIIAQHTYGYPAPMREILELADRHGIPVVEDCCLANGSRYDDRLVGTFGLAAYWSSQWNKPYTTGIGGMATTSDSALADRIARVCRDELLVPRLKPTAMLAAQLAVYNAIVYPRTAAMIQNVFRWLTNAGLVVGSSKSTEYTPMMEPDFFTGMSGVQARRGQRQLRRLERGMRHRREMARLYDQLLRDAGFGVPKLPAGIDPVLVRYPVRVADKKRALADASRHFVELGSWFESPLHPHETNLADYGYVAGMCPTAERACREVVNLPLHPRTNLATAERSVAYVKTISPALG